jgi:hypothetical protein
MRPAIGSYRDFDFRELRFAYDALNIFDSPRVDVQFDCLFQIRLRDLDRFALGSDGQIETPSNKPFTVKLNGGIKLSHGKEYPP